MARTVPQASDSGHPGGARLRDDFSVPSATDVAAAGAELAELRTDVEAALVDLLQKKRAEVNALEVELARRRAQARAAAEERRKLTPDLREKVLELARAGEPEKVIADRLGAAPRTISRATKQLRDEGRLVNFRRRRRPH
jgi:DNA-binding NarL/FixJ family response regulator